MSERGTWNRGEQPAMPAGTHRAPFGDRSAAGGAGSWACEGQLLGVGGCCCCCCWAGLAGGFRPSFGVLESAPHRPIEPR